MKLSALADFHLVANAGSLGLASRDSGRPKATLSRQILQLEDSLGVRLIERGPRGVQLTRDGQSLYEETHALLRDIEDTGRRIASGQQQVRGLLRVSAPVLFSETAGARLATRFVQRFPGVQLEWIISDHQIDLVADGIDVVIRVNPQPHSELVGRCFAHDSMLLVAPPSRPMPATGEPVSAVAMSGAAVPDIWDIEVDGRPARLVPSYTLGLPSFGMVRDAVCAGAGAALLPHSLAQPELAHGRLALWGTYPQRTIALWVLHNSRRLVSRKISAFVDFVVAAFPDRRLLDEEPRSAPPASP